MGFCYVKTISGTFGAEYVWESCLRGGGSLPFPPLRPPPPPVQTPHPAPPLLRSIASLPTPTHMGCFGMSVANL